MVRSTSIALALAFGFCGCAHSSTYVPKQKGKMYLVVDNNALRYFKDGHKVALSDEDAIAMFRCDEAATRKITESIDDHGTANMWAPLAMGLIPALIVGTYRRNAFAEGVDAMNIHNDAAACQHPESKANR